MSNLFFYNKSSSHIFDITVVGGGLTGSLMIYLLLSNKKLSKSKICWIKPKDKNLTDDRVSFYNSSNLEKLSKSKFLQNFPEKEITIVNEIHVLNKRQKKPLIWKNFPYMGFILKNKVVQKKLLDDIKNVKIYNSPVIKSYSDEFYRTIILEDKTVISSNLILAADGSNSNLRKLSSIKYLSHQLNHEAVTGYLEIENSNINIARQAFLDEGPIGLLPVKSKQKYVNFVWSMNKNVAKNILCLDNPSLIIANKLNNFYKSYDLKFKPIKDLSKRKLLKIHKWPLNLIFVPKPTSQRLILIGDAAHSIHPLAGQGFNLALEDCFEVENVLEKSMLTGKEFGHNDNLSLYNKNRNIRVKLMSISTTSLFYAFTQNSKILNDTLSKGMEYLNEKKLKNIFIKIANGF